jgi:thioredoxin reductase (NADPH)
MSSYPYKVTSGNITYVAKAVILATGASARYLGLESEDRLKGKGVSACATCDGFFFKDKVIAVIGGGDSAMEEANFLTKFGSKVYLVNRREEFRASPIMLDRVKANSKIEIVKNSAVDEILGEEKVTGLVLKNTVSGELSELDCDGVFIAIGHKPNTDLVKGIAKFNEAGYLQVENVSSKTNVEGLFAAGDVCDPTYRQAITAAGSGCKAALDAQKFIDYKDVKISFNKTGGC